MCCTESSAFATVSNAIVSNGDISYEELKKLLQDTYCGPEYKRTLETKLRSLKYRPGQNIPAFCHELKTVVQEIYGLTDATVIESIAQNHILGKLEPSVQEPAKLLQLTGKCTLESILELVNSKSGENPYIPIDNQAVVASAVSNTSKDCTDGRIDKLESMVEKLCVQVAKLTDDKPNVRKSSSSVSCSHCGNTGHTKQRCYKLKDCYQCGRKGHIAKHCRDKNQAGNGTNRMNEMSSAHTKVSEGQCADIAVVPRIMLQAEMGGAKIPLLYDPGSMYSMITRAEFERLPQKPPLMPASRSGIGISGEKFELDGVAHLNIRFYREDGSSYLLEYQPVLVSSKIKSNILGMQTELQFKGATRDHLNRLLTFIPHNDVNITLKYWKESSNKESSCVQVAKATIVPTNSVKYVRSKIINANSRGLAEHPFIFTPSYEMQNELEVRDVFLPAITKHITLPVYNTGVEDVYLNKGEALGHINELEYVTSSEFFDPENDTVDCDTSDVKQEVRNFDHLSATIQERATKMLNKYEERLKEPPKVTLVEHEINLQDETPVSLPPRRLPYSQRAEVQRQLKELLQKDVIEPSRSQFASPIVMVKKKDGSLRTCVDYRALNAKTIPRTFPIPRIDELLDKLNGAKIFTILDLKSGYHHIPMAEKDREKTAFVLPDNKFQWKRLPFGRVGAPFSFAAAMKDVLQGTEAFTATYFDDILIFSNSLEEHMIQLENVLTILAEAGMQINRKKCDFIKENVEFIGHSVSAEGLKPLQSKLDEIVTFRTPYNVEQLRTFLGLAAYYRKFVKDFAIIAQPLYGLLRKQATYNWTDACDKAFHHLKHCLEHSDFLTYPDFTKPFVIITDACDSGIGYVLSQEVNGDMKPITFGGRTLTTAERKYSVTDKELLGLYFACKKCDVYVRGHPFLVYTDHKPLTYMQSFKELINKRYRWIEFLQELGTKIVYLPRKDNVVADYLSRNVKMENQLDVLGSASLHLSADLLDNADILAAQRNDPELQHVVRYLENDDNASLKDSLPMSVRPHIHKLSLTEAGLLVYRHAKRDVVVLPAEQRSEIISICHSEWAAGHFGIFKTHRRILDKFWWPGMHNDVKNFIKNCDICLKVTAQKQKFAAIGRRDFPSKPLEKISIDFLVDLPCTRGGNCHILVVNDCFSKYIQLYPIKDRLAKTAAACLVDYIMRFGIPGQLLSDQDPAYESTLFQELMRGLGITKLRTTAYNPRSNGLTEQANATVKLYLTSVLTQNKQTRNNWDQWLREACFAYNTSVHTSTGFTPAELMVGRKFRVPLDLLYGTIPETNMTSSFDAFRDIINSMYAIARDNMAMRQDRYATSHDEKIVRDDKLLVGDRVYLYLPRLARVKLTPKWNGPFKVMKAAHPVYTVSIPTSKGQISKTVTRDKLKRAGNTMNLVEINLESEENQNSCIQPSTTVPEQLDESSDDDEPANRYNLRPRRNIVNYNRELVSYIAAFR